MNERELFKVWLFGVSLTDIRSVGKPGKPSALGADNRWFESNCSDQVQIEAQMFLTLFKRGKDLEQQRKPNPYTLERLRSDIDVSHETAKQWTKRRWQGQMGVSKFDLQQQFAFRAKVLQAFDDLIEKGA